jgi:hypothetical protein
MSYIPFRDNPDINDKLTAAQLSTIRELSILIDEVSARGVHQDQCACTDDGCSILGNAIAIREANSEETIAWLVAKGVLDLELAWGEVQL